MQPLSALRELEVDYTVLLADMGPLLAQLARGEQDRPPYNIPVKKVVRR